MSFEQEPAIRILFSGEAHDLTFVEVEDVDGKSIRVGEWEAADDLSVLRISRSSFLEAIGEQRETEPAWVVWVNTDLTEGRGYQYPAHVCEIEATARRLAKGACVQGGDAQVTKETIERCRFNGALGMWPAGPVRVVDASEADVGQQRKINAQRDREALVAGALDRAKALGLGAADVEILRGDA